MTSATLRRRAALAALAAASLAVVATSQRRWTLTRAPVSGSTTIPAGAVSADQRVALRLVAPAAFAGQRVEFLVAITAGATEPAGARAQAIVRAESEPWTLPGEVAAHRPIEGRFAHTCVAGRPCDATFTVRWTRDPTAVSGPVTVRWTLTPTARGVGSDPDGRLSVDALQ